MTCVLKNDRQEKKGKWLLALLPTEPVDNNSLGGYYIPISYIIMFINSVLYVCIAMCKGV